MRYITISILYLIISCQSPPDVGHSHDEAGGHTHEEDGRPSVDHTLWTDRTELFVEFPVLTVGEISRFAAHFTILDRHQPVREGSVTVSLIKGKKGIRQTVDAPSSPGIFTPSLQPTEAGLYQLVFDLNTPDYSDRIALDDIMVFSNTLEADKILGENKEDVNVISFLKEQAWKMEFQTLTARQKEIYQIIPTSGIWKVAPSDYQMLVAPVNGRVNFEKGNLIAGRSISKGEVIMTVSSSGLTSNNLSAEIQKAKAALDAARSEYDRKKTLFESKIIPKSEFELVEQKFQVAKTNYETLSKGYVSGGKGIIAPFDGYIKSIEVTNGGFVEQGAALVSITSHKSSLLEARVSPAFSTKLNEITNLWYQPEVGSWSSLSEKGGRILSVGKEVAATQPLLSVYAEVNEAVQMPEGSYTEVQLAIGRPVEVVVVPVSALLEDYGRYSVIVQQSGESFERRNVVIGRQNGSEVEIKDGLNPGEVVVTTGAYQVKMASMSGQAPAHGHAH